MSEPFEDRDGRPGRASSIYIAVAISRRGAAAVVELGEGTTRRWDDDPPGGQRGPTADYGGESG